MNEAGRAVGMTRERVVVRPYDLRWPLEFERVRSELEAALPSWILGIQHVGSTAVPDLDAKPIIDILVGVPSLERGLELRPILESLGFEYRPHDDIPDRHYFPRTIDGLRVHHLSVSEPGSRHSRNTLIFRDVLRADPELRARYAALKHSLVREVGAVRLAYLEGKTDFVLEVLAEHGGEVGGDYPYGSFGWGNRQ